MWCGSNNHTNKRHIAKELLDLSFNYAVIYKISIFKENCPKFHIITKNHNLLKYKWNFLDQPLLPY